MPVPTPCPQCGKTLKLLETMLGKTIRCPICKQTFQAPPAAAPDDIPEVVAVTTADVSTQAKASVPVLEEVRVLKEVREPRSLSRTSSPGRRTNPPAPARKAPPQKKGWGAGLVLGILGGVFLLCAGFGTVAFFVGRAVITEINIPPIPEAEWRTDYRPGNGHCTVSIPGQPGVISQTAAAGSQGNVQKFGSTLDSYHRKFIVAYIDMPPGQLAKLGHDPLQELARVEADNVRTQAGGKLLHERAVLWHALAHEFVMELTDKRLLIERVLVVRGEQNQGAMAYIMAVEGEGLRPDSPEVARFFDSLQIDPPAPPPNPNPQPDPNLGGRGK